MTKDEISKIALIECKMQLVLPRHGTILRLVLEFFI